ncbi:PleD family two-component system response regulator [Pararhizobium sp. IMCC21322]|uniref:PleD family two-component system response regulator n=1 Tax=Pararhizobium sp. IMCC21322 TaxID=3067903 RepID=UPI0027429C8C|nr:PleD family two-component system response regulator [Pararhizobium sp. IMCC21322]
MSIRVLAVDDLQANLKLLSARLTAEYYSVKTLSAGLDTLEYCRNNPIDVVLLDIVMPGLDGFETCRALKSDPLTRDIPIILLTALQDEASRIKGLNAGADDFLSKPVNDVALISRIRNLASQKQTLEDMRTHSMNAFRKDADATSEGDNFEEVDESFDDGRNGQVLVFDDDQTSADKIFRSLSFEQGIKTVTTEVAAIAAISSSDWDAVVVSLGVSSSDPLSFLSQLKAPLQHRHLPTLVVGKPEDEKRLQRSFDLGATNYVVAPYPERELAARMRREVYRHRMLRELRLEVENTLELAVIDPLTGLQNRRFLERQMSTLIDQSLRYKRDLSVMIMDIDKFKSINDVHGHAVGDVVLKEISHRIRRSLRGSDLACRFGGEEFVCVLAETELDVAFLAAERLRKEIESVPFIINDDGSQITVTASFGITQFKGRKDSADAMLKRADEALYRAKEAGRNQVISKAA